MATTASNRKSRRGRSRGVATDLLIPRDRAQEALREQARSFLSTDPVTAKARAALASNEQLGAEDWAKLAELEWLGILIGEAHGGAGGSMSDACVLLEEIGRTLLPAPFLGTAILAATALRGAPAMLGELAAGRLRATAAVESDVVVTTDLVPRATGSAAAVVDAVGIDLIAIAARDASGEPMLVAARAQEGAEIELDRSIDPLRPSATVTLDAAPVTIVATGAAAEATVAEVATLGAIGLAAELAGGASRCVEMTLDYAKSRTQFGQAIGSFQAVKHRCVDAFMSTQAALAAVRHAARLADAGSPDCAAAASLARIEANRAIAEAASCALQVHGGAGYLWDNDAHLYLRRGKGAERVLGRPWTHREQLAHIFGV